MTVGAWVPLYGDDGVTAAWSLLAPLDTSEVIPPPSVGAWVPLYGPDGHGAWSSLEQPAIVVDDPYGGGGVSPVNYRIQPKRRYDEQIASEDEHAMAYIADFLSTL